MIDVRSILRVIDFFVPIDILVAVIVGGLVVFGTENLLDSYVTAYVPEAYANVVWFLVVILGIIVLSVFSLLSADEDEIDELEEDIDDVLNGEEKV